MKSDLRKRLDALEHGLELIQKIIVITEDTDPPELRDQLVDRWKSGEDVDAVKSQYSYQGGKIEALNVVLITTPQTEAAKQITAAVQKNSARK